MTQKEYQKDSSREYQRPYQDNQDSINSKDFLIGALIGGVVGAAAALFMAPKSGKELMSDLNVQAKNLGEKTEKFRQVAMEKGEVLREKSGTVTEMVSNKSSDLVNKVKSFTSSNGTGTGAKNSDEYVTDVSETVADYETASPEVVPTTSTADASSSSSTLAGVNAAQLKLDETKKAFEETENKYNR
jgi:gas vesicle protein